jgi:3'5'-cyclic nucleotide phosphodiesterase
MHCSTVFKIMQNPDACILQNLPKDELSAVRTMIIELILSTDIVKHFNIIGKFKSKITSNTILALPTPEQRVEIMKIVMKASDVGHAAKTHDLHVEWSKLIIDEFFTQGDLEKQREMPVSMFCDRETTDLSKSQSSFIKNIVQPIFESLNSYLVSSKIKESCLDQLITNTLYWESTYPKKRGMTQKIKVHPIKKIRKKMGQTVKVK